MGIGERMSKPEKLEVELFGIQLNDQSILEVDSDELITISSLLQPGSFGKIYRSKLWVGDVYRYGVHWLPQQKTWLSAPMIKPKEKEKE